MRYTKSVTITLDDDEMEEAVRFWLRKHKLDDLVRRMEADPGDGERDFNFCEAEVEVQTRDLDP